MKKSTQVVSFRAPQELLRQIDEARLPLDESRGDWVRNIVVAHFHSQNQHLLLDELLNLRDQFHGLSDDVQQVQKNLAKATYLLLLHHGVPREEAKNLVRSIVGRKEQDE
jgi:hypothetical protein